jgi:phosphoglycerate dehydrogenase-like enzyme
MLDDDIQRDTILITSWIEPELVERVRREVPGISVVYEPDLLRPPPSASILFDFDPTHRDDLPELAPRVRWIQATSAGIGQLVRRMDYGRRMPNTVFTTASGVHARPLSDFVLLSMLSHVRCFLEMTRNGSSACGSWASSGVQTALIPGPSTQTSFTALASWTTFSPEPTSWCWRVPTPTTPRA